MDVQTACGILKGKPLAKQVETIKRAIKTQVCVLCNVKTSKKKIITYPPLRHIKNTATFLDCRVCGS